MSQDVLARLMAKGFSKEESLEIIKDSKKEAVMEQPIHLIGDFVRRAWRRNINRDDGSRTHVDTYVLLNNVRISSWDSKIPEYQVDSTIGVKIYFLITSVRIRNERIEYVGEIVTDPVGLITNGTTITRMENVSSPKLRQSIPTKQIIEKRTVK